MTFITPNAWSCGWTLFSAQPFRLYHKVPFGCACIEQYFSCLLFGQCQLWFESERPFLTAICVRWREHFAYLLLTSCEILHQLHPKMPVLNLLARTTGARANCYCDVKDGGRPSTFGIELHESKSRFAFVCYFQCAMAFFVIFHCSEKQLLFAEDLFWAARKIHECGIPPSCSRTLHCWELHFWACTIIKAMFVMTLLH